MKLFSLILVLFVSLLAACGKKEEVSHNTLEDIRATSSANGLWNAQQYRAANPRFDEGFKLVPHADTHINGDCPGGSGWASLSIMKVEGKVVEKIDLTCSTYSASLGCYRTQDFDKGAFAGKASRCAPVGEVPSPLPKIAK